MNISENHIIKHGVRKYEPETGRFLSIDPLWEKYPGWTPYQYSMNDPVNKVDVTGLKPGDLFRAKDSQSEQEAKDAAAIDFAEYYNGVSISKNIEYCSRLYSLIGVDGYKYFGYTEANEGDDERVDIPETPNGKKSEGSAHTHGAWTKKLVDEKGTDWNIRLSGRDIENASRNDNPDPRNIG